MLSGPVRPELHTFRSSRFESVVQEAVRFLQKTPIHSLPPPRSFVGAGVYALYYLGDSQHYAHIAVLNKDDCVSPIYVGKAVPPGWRMARISGNESHNLYGRLRGHARSIEQGRGLEVHHFRCRFTILRGIETDLISAVEAQLIRLFAPVWNSFIDGFGNHDPGKGRYNQARSEWDILHPGREWAGRLTGPPPRLQSIVEKIARHKRQSALA